MGSFPPTRAPTHTHLIPEGVSVVVGEALVAVDAAVDKVGEDEDAGLLCPLCHGRRHGAELVDRFPERERVQPDHRPVESEAEGHLSAAP